MFKTLKNAWKVPDIRKKIIFTLVILFVFRLGASIPVPFISSDVASSFNNAYGGKEPCNSNCFGRRSKNTCCRNEHFYNNGNGAKRRKENIYCNRNQSGGVK